MKILVILSLLISVSVEASSGGGHHGPTTWEEFLPSLFWPSFNVVLLGAALYWKLKEPIRNFFKNKSQNISEIMERANLKAKEAEMMMQIQRKKLDGMEDEIKKIHSDVNSEVEIFKEAYIKDVDNRIEKLKVDASSKIQAEKNQLTNQLNEMLLNEVIEKAKTTIKSNKDLGQDATSKILEGLR